jgi:hypothetical protein
MDSKDDDTFELDADVLASMICGEAPQLVQQHTYAEGECWHLCPSAQTTQPLPLGEFANMTFIAYRHSLNPNLFSMNVIVQNDDSISTRCVPIHLPGSSSSRAAPRIFTHGVWIDPALPSPFRKELDPRLSWSQEHGILLNGKTHPEILRPCGWRRKPRLDEARAFDLLDDMFAFHWVYKNVVHLFKLPNEYFKQMALPWEICPEMPQLQRILQLDTDCFVLISDKVHYIGSELDGWTKLPPLCARDATVKNSTLFVIYHMAQDQQGIAMLDVPKLAWVHIFSFPEKIAQVAHCALVVL